MPAIKPVVAVKVTGNTLNAAEVNALKTAADNHADLLDAADLALAGKVAGTDARLSDARAPTAHGHAAGQVSGLAQVATTGNYNDLLNKPTGGTVNENGRTMFMGSSGNFATGVGVDPGASNLFVFLPLNTVTTNFNLGWNATTRRYTIPIAGTYLVITQVRPGTDASTANGADYYCGPSTGTAGDTPDGAWGNVSPSTRRSIKIPTSKYYAVGAQVGLAHYQEGAIFGVLCSLSIVLLKAE